MSTVSSIVAQLNKVLDNANTKMKTECADVTSLVGQLTEMLDVNNFSLKSYNIQKGILFLGIQGSMLLDATSLFVQGGLYTKPSYNYVLDSTTILRVGNAEPRIILGSNKTVSVYLNGVANLIWEICVITSSGATKIENNSGDIVANTDYILSGWKHSHETYEIPEDCEYVWITVMKDDGSTITPSELHDCIIYEVA